MKKELWDAYNKNFQQVENITLIRGEKIPEGMYHLVGDIIVQHIDGEYLLMKRSPDKHFGNLWELTAGGSALKGETELQCAIRELEEETGINHGQWKELARIKHDQYQTLYVLYLCVTDIDKKSIILQTGETIDYEWISYDDLARMPIETLCPNRALDYIFNNH